MIQQHQVIQLIIIMVILLTSNSRAAIIAELITVLLIFILVLVITALTTRFVGGYQKLQGKNRNLEVIETIRVANNKYVQIVRAADKYIGIGSGKNEISMLTEVNGDALINSGQESTAGLSFSAIIDSAKAKFSK